MGKVGRFYHEVVNTTDVTVTDSFQFKSDLNLNDCSPPIRGLASGAAFNGRLEGLIIRVKSISAGPTPSKLIIKVTHAANGTQVIIPDTEATIALEVGSTTEGGVAYKFDFPYVHTDDELHIFYKTDVATSTLTVDALELYWSE